MSRLKILLAIPSARTVETECFESIFNLKKHGKVDLFVPHSYSIDASRNMVAEYALNHKYDYILWIDSDTIVPKNTLTRLLEADKDIVSGVYAYKILSGKNVVAKRYNDKEEDTYDDLTIKEVAELSKTKERVLVDAIGFGCVLTKTTIFSRVDKPWFVYSQYMGEDIFFCRKAQEQDYEIWLDTAVLCGHVGTVNYNIARGK